MIKKILLPLLIVLFSVNNLSASNNNTDNSQLHFKSGEVVKGRIIERNDKKITIDRDGVIEEYSCDEISYVSHEGYTKSYDTQSFRGFIDFSYSFGVGAPRDNVFSIETSFGYQFSHYLYLGGGLSVNFHDPQVSSYPLRGDRAESSGERNDPNWRFPFIPVYVNVRSQLYDGARFTPYADLKVGASVINNIGFYCAPTIGIHVPTKGLLALNIGVGYTMQQAKYKLWSRGEAPGAKPDGTGSAYISKNVILSGISVKLGIEF